IRAVAAGRSCRLGEGFVRRRADAGARDRLALGLHDPIEVAERVLELLVGAATRRRVALTFRPTAAAGLGRAARAARPGDAARAFRAGARAGDPAAALVAAVTVLALAGAEAVLTLGAGRPAVLTGAAGLRPLLPGLRAVLAVAALTALCARGAAVLPGLPGAGETVRAVLALALPFALALRARGPALLARRAGRLLTALPLRTARTLRALLTALVLLAALTLLALLARRHSGLRRRQTGR